MKIKIKCDIKVAQYHDKFSNLNEYCETAARKFILCMERVMIMLYTFIID